MPPRFSFSIDLTSSVNAPLAKKKADFKPFFSSKYGDFDAFFLQKKSFKHLGTRFIYLFILSWCKFLPQKSIGTHDSQPLSLALVTKWQNFNTHTHTHTHTQNNNNNNNNSGKLQVPFSSVFFIGEFCDIAKVVTIQKKI
jgi:hypothetical protein